MSDNKVTVHIDFWSPLWIGLAILGFMVGCTDVCKPFDNMFSCVGGYYQGMKNKFNEGRDMYRSPNEQE